MAGNRKRGRPAMSEYEKRMQRISFRVTDEELRAFEEECDRRGLTKSDVLHDFIIDFTNKCS